MNGEGTAKDITCEGVPIEGTCLKKSPIVWEIVTINGIINGPKKSGKTPPMTDPT
jgi:hypothetical protein